MLYKKTGTGSFYLNRDLQGLFIFGVFLIAGYAASALRYDSVNPSQCLSDSTDAYLAVVSGREREGDKTEQYLFHIIKLRQFKKWVATDQKTLVYLPVGDTSRQLPLSCTVLVKGHPSPVRATAYRGLFDFKKYLAGRNIHSLHYLKQNEFLVVRAPKGHTSGAAIASLRKRLRDHLKTMIPDHKAYGVALAMLLGDKSELENDLRNAYNAAGVAHILAVSGLHTGVIFLIVSWLFMPVKRSGSIKWMYYVLVTGSIWFYALLTGLSPSVTRAALMLSFVLAGTIAKGRYQVYNALAASAFFLLLVQPRLIYSVSFQLSYLAVFGIILLYPKLRNLVQPKGLVTGYFWKIVCVSVAAQTATFPLVIYYFHQFSPFFLVSNLFILPAAAVIIIAGTLLLITGSLGLSIPFLNKSLETVLRTTNNAVFTIDSLPGSTIDQLFLDSGTVWIIYLLLALVITSMYYRSERLVMVAAALSVLLGMDLTLQTIRNHKQGAIIVYKQAGHVRADFIAGNTLLKYYSGHYTPNENLPVSLPDSIRSYRVHKTRNIFKSDKIHSTALYDLIVFKGKRLLFLKQLPAALPHDVHVDYLCANNFHILSSIGKLKNLHYARLLYAGPAVIDGSKPLQKQSWDQRYTNLNTEKILHIRL